MSEVRKYKTWTRTVPALLFAIWVVGLINVDSGLARSTTLRGFNAGQKTKLTEASYRGREKYTEIHAAVAVCGSGTRAFVRYEEATIGPYSGDVINSVSTSWTLQHPWNCTGYRAAWNLEGNLYTFHSLAYRICIRAKVSRTARWSSKKCKTGYTDVMAPPVFSEIEGWTAPHPYCMKPDIKRAVTCRRL